MTLAEQIQNGKSKSLERQKRHISFDEEICYDLEFDELDLSPLYARFESIGKPITQDKLKNLKLIKLENGKIHPTNALMILLGKFPHCTVKCARVKGTFMNVFIDKKEYGGDIFSVLENTQAFVLNFINLKGEIKGLYRTDTYELPVVALCEVLVNSLVHRDYVNQDRDIKVDVYDNVVNVISPGSLPFNITIEDIFSGRSEARNRVVAHVFKELGLIEQWGSGISRIINACKDQGLEAPRIAEKNDFFDVEIIRPVVIEEQPELQPELQPEFKIWIDSGLEKEKREVEQELEQEIEQELEQESLFSKILSKMLDKPKSRKEISRQLNQKSISGQLNEVLGKLYDRNLLEWTIPEKPNSSKQKFKLTKKGLAFYLLTRKEGGDL